MARLALFDADLDLAFDGGRDLRTVGEAMEYLRGLGPAWAGDAEIRDHLAGRMVREGAGEMIVSERLC